MQRRVDEDAVMLFEHDRETAADWIHAGPAQALANASMRLEIIQRLLNMERIDDGVRELGRLQVILRDGLADIRRLLADLRPVREWTSGFAEALWPCVNRFSQRSKIDVQVSGDFPVRFLEDPVRTVAYRAVEAVLQQCFEGGTATNIAICLSTGDTTCIIEIFEMGVVSDGVGANEQSLRLINRLLAFVDGEVYVSPSSAENSEGNSIIVSVPRRLA